MLLRWSVDGRTARRRLRGIPQDRLPYYAIGRDRLYRIQDVIAYIESRRVS